MSADAAARRERNLRRDVAINRELARAALAIAVLIAGRVLCAPDLRKRGRAALTSAPGNDAQAVLHVIDKLL